jgi:hypothetical protein
MNDFQLTKHNLARFFDEIQSELVDHPILIVSVQDAGTGKWGMARLWRAWMGVTASFMSDNGVRMPLMYDKNGKPYGSRLFNANDAHELFTAQHMGVDEHGNRLSWAKSDQPGRRKATKGERYNAMMKHNIWCTERGILLFQPKDSEFRQLTDQQTK